MENYIIFVFGHHSSLSFFISPLNTTRLLTPSSKQPEHSLYLPIRSKHHMEMSLKHAVYCEGQAVQQRRGWRLYSTRHHFKGPVFLWFISFHHKACAKEAGREDQAFPLQLPNAASSKCSLMGIKSKETMYKLLQLNNILITTKWTPSLGNGLDVRVRSAHTAGLTSIVNIHRQCRRVDVLDVAVWKVTVQKSDWQKVAVTHTADCNLRVTANLQLCFPFPISSMSKSK